MEQQGLPPLNQERTQENREKTKEKPREITPKQSTFFTSKTQIINEHN